MSAIVRNSWPHLSQRQCNTTRSTHTNSARSAANNVSPQTGQSRKPMNCAPFSAPALVIAVTSLRAAQIGRPYEDKMTFSHRARQFLEAYNLVSEFLRCSKSLHATRLARADGSIVIITRGRRLQICFGSVLTSAAAILPARYPAHPQVLRPSRCAFYIPRPGELISVWSMSASCASASRDRPLA